MIRIALIGAGGMGKRWAKALSDFDGVSPVAVVDKDRGTAEEVARQYGGKIFESVDDLLKNENLDACVIAVPHIVLAKISSRVLEAGKHVLAEKPGASTAQEMEENIALARNKKLRLMVGYNYRYFPGPMRAKEIVDSGRVGDVVFIRARHGFGGRPGYEKNWRLKKSEGGGQLIDQGVHMIDLCRWFLGDITEAQGILSDVFWKTGVDPVRSQTPSASADAFVYPVRNEVSNGAGRTSNGVEDNAFALLKSKNGVVASIHASWTQWDPMFSFEVYGTKGSVVVDGLGRKYGKGERVIVGKRNDDFSFAEEEIIECDPDADKALWRELEEFVHAIQEKRDPRPSGKDGLEVLKVVESIYRSSR